MKRLEIKKYTRLEIAELMELNPSDQNFKTKLITRLNNWGYGYNYTTKVISITSVPSSPESILKEYLIRKLSLDIQTDFIAYAIFFYLLFTDYDFQTSPWATKSDIIKADYGRYISEPTLRHWAARLVKKGFIIKDTSTAELWITTITDGVKAQRRVENDELDAYKEYHELRSKYLKEADKLYQEENNTTALNPKRWSIAGTKLWKEKRCCYYTVKPFVFGAFYDDNDFFTIIDLIAEVYYGIPMSKPSNNTNGFVF